MKKIVLLTLIGIVLLTVSALGSFETDNEASFEGSPDMEAQFASMRRTACLVLSRYHSNTQKHVIEDVVKSLTPQDQQKYINKVYAVAVEGCEQTITQSEVQELFVENPSFDPGHLFYHFDKVDYKAIGDNFSTFSPNEESIVKFMKKFDEEM